MTTKEIIKPAVDSDQFLTRVIGVLTTSDHKITEISNWLSQYGVQTVKLDPTGDYIGYLKSSTAKFRVIAVIKEQTFLYQRGTETLAQRLHLELVDHISVMKVFTWNSKDNELETTRFKSSTLGYLDLNRALEVGQAKYDWDDIFVVDNLCHQTYIDLARQNIKISSRDKNISQCILQYIHYKKAIDLAHHPQRYETPIDFSHDPKDYIASIPEFNSEVMSKLGITNILTVAMNQGVFFRAAKTRRQKLYWCPGLNAGIPFTPKPKDAKHELTYQMHDFSHFNIPDLVFDRDGVTKEEQALRKKVYISYRLMSESITLVLADMIFVHMLVKSGFKYETMNQRKIYQIFSEFEKKTPDFEKNLEAFIYQLLKGSFEYCFYQDTSIWSSLMDAKTDSGCGCSEKMDVLQVFSGKYDSYFMEDFKWTLHNYEDMIHNKTAFQEWWTSVQGWRQSGHNLELQSVSEFIDENQLQNLTDQRFLLETIFNSVYNKYIKRLFMGSKIGLDNANDRLKNTMIRYQMGQALIFFKHQNYPDSQPTFAKIDEAITHWNPDRVKHLRSFYSNYLQKLEQANLITPDDCFNYSQIYPIFNPMIINYEQTQTLSAEFVNKIIN